MSERDKNGKEEVRKAVVAAIIVAFCSVSMWQSVLHPSVCRLCFQWPGRHIGF